MKWLTQNWGLKVVAFILAVALWSYARGEEGIEVTRVVPLDVTIENPQISLLDMSTNVVQVTLVAPRALLSDLASAEIRAHHVIDKNTKTAGEYSFRLQPGDVDIPTPQIRIVSITPATVQVTLDEVIVKKLKVEPQFFGDPAYGYRVDQEGIQLNPNAILIEGPKAKLESLGAALTEMIDLVGRIRSFRRTITLDLPPNMKAVTESLIDIYVPIAEEYTEKKIENVPVKILRSSGSLRIVQIEPEAMSIVLKGSRRHLEKIETGNVLAYVDISSLDYGEYEKTAELVLPEGVTLKDESPLVKIKISKS